MLNPTKKRQARDWPECVAPQEYHHILSSAMLNKALSRAVSHVRRSFHSSASVARVVATSPVKAQEVQVGHHTHPDPLFFIHPMCSLWDLENTLSLNTSMMLLLCE